VVAPEPPVEPAVKISGDAPRLPEVARRRKMTGSVLVDIEVDEQGHVASVVIRESGGAILDVAVRAALKDWKFRPATRDGVPVRGTLPYRFSFR
jgi:TonB family protein